MGPSDHGCHVSSSSECLLRRCSGLAGSVGRIWQAYCKPSCSWLPGREELYSAAITEGVKSIGQPFNGEWAALSLAPGGSRLNGEGLRALKEELKSVVINYPISERDKLRRLLETELAARFCLAPDTCLPCATHTTADRGLYSSLGFPARRGCTAPITLLRFTP